MRFGWARGIMAEIDPAGAVALTAWSSPPGVGTPVVSGDSDEAAWSYFSGGATAAPNAPSAGWVARLLAETDRACDLSGVFALFVYDKRRRRLLAFTDRLGVQGVHYSRQAAGGWRVSTHLGWLLLAGGHDGSVNAAGFLTQMAFGYGVDPHRDVYRDVVAVRAGHYVSLAARVATPARYWSMPEPSSCRLDAVEPLVDTLRQALIEPATPEPPVFLGLTAGKDSLCLASVVPDAVTVRTGTLGRVECADQQQGAALAEERGWPHVRGSLCDEPQFFEWADVIAFHSAGLSTVSYVDMACFAATHIPSGSAFAMGEGGECVRDFFHSTRRTPLQTLVDDYMTPVDYLQQTLAASLGADLSGYPFVQVDALRSATGERDAERFVSFFYRAQRMPGNFALRHAVLSVLRPKLSPFLDSRFIDATYALDTQEHAGSNIHRRLIAAARPSLLAFFDAPATSRESTQAWPVRFPQLLTRFKRELATALPLCGDVFDAAGALTLCDAAAAQPSRAIYHLFRVYSFARARLMLSDRDSQLRAINATCERVVVSGAIGAGR